MSQEVRFVEEGSQGVDVTVLLGDGSVKPSTGIGGWSTLERKRRVSMSNFAGSDPIKLDIPLLLDGYADGQSVQAQLDALVSLGRNVASYDEEPPSFRIYGSIQFQGTLFVMENLEFGDDLREDGILYRQALIAHVAEYVSGDILAFQAARAAGGKKKHRGRYTVKKGDTLYSIAVKIYHDKSRWKDIAQVNGIRDPKKLKVGRSLNLP